MASPSPLGGCLTNTQPVDMEVCFGRCTRDLNPVKALNHVRGSRELRIPNDSGEMVPES